MIPWQLQLLLLGGLLSTTAGQGQGSFVDADKANEYTDQKFDLRHTIPGEPGIDYPILSAVPKTSFLCKERHEGYYADVESRCQAFRICAHTARSPQGFGFLCPNGTLFNQQHFVCDWYRNVNCDESERFYDMNRDSTVGTTSDMMQRVRQMMEYPMKTITKALQQIETTVGQPKRTHQTLSKDLSSESAVLGQPAAPIKAKKTAVTREQIESVATAKITRGEAIKSEPVPAPSTEDGEDIYVNSLGELSSDPGINFDHTNAHIIAEYPREYHFQKQKNFAERVNLGLNELSELPSEAEVEVMAPDYIKRIRNTKDEATQLDLVSNINNLLDEVSTDLDPSVSGYQVMKPQKQSKQPFRFLSRGFAMHDKTTPAYVYTRPKQTENTVRFTSNEIPIDTHKDLEHKPKFKDDKITSTTEAVKAEFEPLLIAPAEPEEEETTTTSLPVATTTTPATTTTSLTTTSTTTTSTEASSVTLSATPLPALAILPLALLAPPLLPGEEPFGQTAALTASEDYLQTGESSDKTDADEEAAKLLLAGVQLSAHDDATANNELTLGRPSSSSSWTSTFTTPAMVTSTETVTEISSIQERIRGYRRFAHQKRAPQLQQLQQSQQPAQIYGRRAVVRPLKRSTTTQRAATQRTKTTTTTSSTTTPTPTPTRSYLERLAASRLRLSRLSVSKTAAQATTTAAATATTTTTAKPTTTATASSALTHVRGGVELGPNKKLAVRNIERETGGSNQLLTSASESPKSSLDTVHSNLQRFQVQRGNRNYTPAPRPTSSSSSNSYSTVSSLSSTSTSRTVTVNSNRGRNRYSNYKTQTPRTRGTTANTFSSTRGSSSSTTANPLRTTSAALSTLTQHISALASNYNQAAVERPSRRVQPTQTYIHNHPHTPTQAYANTQTVSGSSSSTSQDSVSPSGVSSSFLPFDTLTRAIVDDSVLQNYKSTHSKPATTRSSAQTSYYQQQQQQQQRMAKPAATTTAAQTAALSYAKKTATAPTPSTTGQLALPKPPGIVITRVEGQRIQPNSVNNIVASLVSQPQTLATPSNSYVSLNDFLNNKFGQTEASSPAATAATLQRQQQRQQQQQQPQQQPLLQQPQQQQRQQQLPQQQQQQRQPQQQQQFHYQQHVTQQQQPQQQQQQQQLNYITQHYQQPQQQQYQQHIVLQQQHQQQLQPQQQQQHIYYTQPQQHQQQQHHQQQPYQQQQHHNQQQHHQQFQQQQFQQPRAVIQTNQQPYLTPNIFLPYQQQQQQLPQFPPLAQPLASTSTVGRGRAHNIDHYNVQLPSLQNGLIPTPKLQLAQRRSDGNVGALQLSDGLSKGRARAFYSGATSYDVAQSSVGRLPNDVTQMLRRRQRQRRY